MIPAKLLLIEDSPADAAQFCDQIQNELGNEVEIVWHTSLSAAMHWLKAEGNKPDQIWLDPALLGTQNIGKNLALLKECVPPGELRLFGSTPSIVHREAQRHEVEVVRKETDSQLLAIVQDLVAKRSSGSGTVKIELARFEGTIAKLEYQVSENCNRLARVEQIIERLNTINFELTAMKDAVNKIPAIQEQLAKSQGFKELRLKRMDFLQAVMISLISAGVALGSIALPKIIDKLEHPNAPSPSPSQTQKSP